MRSLIAIGMLLGTSLVAQDLIICTHSGELLPAPMPEVSFQIQFGDRELSVPAKYMQRVCPNGEAADMFLRNGESATGQTGLTHIPLAEALGRPAVPMEDIAWLVRSNDQAGVTEVLVPMQTLTGSWRRVQQSAATVERTMTNGILKLDSMRRPHGMHYYKQQVPEAANRKLELEIDMQAMYGTNATSAIEDAGIGISIGNSHGTCWLLIHTNAVYLHGREDPVIKLDTTDRFHTYKVRVEGPEFTLEMDNRVGEAIWFRPPKNSQKSPTPNIAIGDPCMRIGGASRWRFLAYRIYD